jgi:hypothetical protein
VLVKDAELLARWQDSARQVVHVETELSGVYEAARTLGRENYPILAVRGLSDIVGFTRDPEWTAYACQTAAAYTVAVLRSGLIDFGKQFTAEARLGVRTTNSRAVAETHAPAAVRDAPEPPALAVWKERLAFLEVEQAKASDAAAKFKLEHDIDEARKKIRDLGRTP